MQTSSIASRRSSSSMLYRSASYPRGFQTISVRAPCHRISGHACMRTAARVASCSSGWNVSHASHVPPSQRNTVCAAGGGGSLAEAMLESRGKGVELESLQLESDLRGKVSAAVEDLGCRVTVGDVAARAGVKTSDAEMALQALAADSQGTLEVSNEGDIVYALPLDFQATIRARSWWLRAQPTVAKLVAAGEYLVRVTFGTALITSVLLVWVTIMAILTSQSSSSDDRRRSNNSGFGGGGRGMGVWFNPVDVLWYWDPYYFQRRRERRASGEGMTFVESIFSFVFGDGDPNEDFEEMRWRTVGRYIQARGGVVTAEELAPYLDPPVFGTGIAAQAEGISIDRSPLDESFVVPVLVRFNGHPEVDEGGNLLYTFPQLQTTSSMRASAVPIEKLALKAEWQMSGASEGQRLGTIALGVANVVGVLVLSNLLLDPQVVYALSRSSLAFVGNAMPLLQAYAVSFFAIPLARYLAYQRRNASIEAENDARRDALARLRMPEPGLVAKLESASQRAQRRVIQDEDLVYRSDRNLTDQKQAGTAGGVDWEAEDFERRLGNRS